MEYGTTAHNEATEKVVKMGLKFIGKMTETDTRHVIKNGVLCILWIKM
jgi:hypothetical protein